MLTCGATTSESFDFFLFKFPSIYGALCLKGFGSCGSGSTCKTLELLQFLFFSISLGASSSLILFIDNISFPSFFISGWDPSLGISIIYIYK